MRKRHADPDPPGSARGVQQLPPDMKAVAEREFTRAAAEARVDVAKLNDSLQAALAAKGMQFNTVDPNLFHDALRKAGFYTEWKGKFGDQACKTLEASVGELA